MHSSRMRSVHYSGRWEGGGLPGAGVCPGEGGMSAQGASDQGDGMSHRVVCPGGVSAQGVSAQGDV